MGAQGIGGDLVAAPRFDVFEPFAAGGPVAPSLDHPEAGQHFRPIDSIVRRTNSRSARNSLA
jgi:hypothetical protein